MASKALLLLLARAARSAAAATYRVASLAERRALSPASDAPRSSGGRPAAAVPGRVEFVPKEEDLESDEVLWGLYERWCKAFNQKREPDEMARRFNKFKNRALRVRDMNNANANRPYKLGLTKFSDGKLAELRANRDPLPCMLADKFRGPSCRRRRGDDKYLMEVYADFDVVDGKLFVFFPVEKGNNDGVGYCRKEISAEFEVLSGRLFVADLPAEGAELFVPNPEVLARRLIPGYLR